MDHYEGPMIGLSVTTCKVEITRRDPAQEKEFEKGSGAFQAIMQQEVSSEKEAGDYVVTFVYMLAYMLPGRKDPMIEGRGTYVVKIPEATVMAGAHVWTKPVVRRVVNDLLHQFAAEAYPLAIKYPPLPDDDPDILGSCQQVSKDYAKIFQGVILN